MRMETGMDTRMNSRMNSKTIIKREGECMQRKTLFSAALAVMMLALLLAACPTDADLLYLVDGSQGEPGNGRVIDLTPGDYYMVKIGYKWYPVKGDGTMGKQLVPLNRITMARAVADGEIQPLLGTSIGGFSNDQIVNVFAYIGSLTNDDFGEGYTVVPNDTKKRNTIIDLSAPLFMGGGPILGNPNNRQLYFEEGIEDIDTTIIFLTGDVNNYTESYSWTTDPRWPVVVQGGPDYSYELRIGARSNSFTVSTSNPFEMRVSDMAGEKGYFSVSGSIFGTLAVVSKRGQGSAGTIGQ